MEVQKVSPRVRIHFEQNSKGAVARDVTGEGETAAEASGLLREGLAELEAHVKQRGLKFTDEV